MSIGYMLSNVLGNVFKTNISNYCQLETNKASGDPYDMVTREGGLLTAFEIKGTYSIMGENNTYEQIHSLVDGLSSILKRPGHRIQFVFRRDPLNSREALRMSIDGALRTMKKLDLDLAGMIKERGELLEKKTVLETCHMVLVTYPKAMHPDILKVAQKEREAYAKKNGGMKPGLNAQSPNVEMPGIEMIHSGFVSQVISKLQEKLSITKLSNQEYLLQLRKQITQYDTSDRWRAYLTGDAIPMRLVDETPMAGDLTAIMAPNISQQLFSRRPYIAASDSTIVDIGEWFVAPVMVDQRPQDIKLFSELFSSIDRDVPWQFSLSLDSGSDRVTSMISRKRSFASFVAFASSENKLIRDGAERLLDMAVNNVMVSAQMTFSTWGRDLEQARRNKSKLKSAVEAWGQLQVIEERGDPIEAWLNTLPGFSGKHLATPIPLSVEEAMSMAPITRPVSPWSAGTMLYRTIDEKVFPFLPGSSLQNANMEIVFAPPGYGKSFYLAASNMGLITRPGNEVLPRIGILDIGYSSAMFVDMVKEALPPSKKHYAQSFRLEMDAAYAVNFFDTPLGCQRPLKVDREYVINMMTLLCTPAGRKEPISRMPELISNLVDEMYEYFAEENNPNLFETGIDSEVDKALELHQIRVQEGSSWWRVVRLLFQKGLYKEATLAQRYAVPTLNDATTVLFQSSSIRDVYGKSMVENGAESLIEYLKTMLIAAVQDYPILSMPTVFSLGDARIVSIDLMSVARDGSDQAQKKTAVMYMLGRQIICQNFYRKVQYTIPDIPDEYKDYHRKQIEMDEAVPKKFCMDEFHRTSSVPSVRHQAVVDIREGRKYGVHVSLLSQLMEDFDPAMIKLINNVIILSKGTTEMGAREIKEIFGPSPDAMKAMSRWLTGPGPEGSSMLYLGQLKSETAPRVEQVIRLTLGPTEMWAYSTTPEDVSLRDRVSARVGLSNALLMLAKAYPKGSAVSDIQRMLNENSAELDDMDASHSIYDILAEKLIKENKDMIS